MKIFTLPILMYFSFLILSCDLMKVPLINLDLKPPEIDNVAVKESRNLEIEFSEEVTIELKECLSIPSLPVKNYRSIENKIVIEFEVDQEAGVSYRFRGRAIDKFGNGLSFIIRFYGWNPHSPDLLINEFNPEGSGNNPDTVELFVKRGGNTAGISLFLGTKNHNSGCMILPSLNIEQGEFIILHLRPEFIKEEINEREDKTISAGKLSSPEGWDLWAKKDTPLSGKNGVICLYSNPFGEIIDAVPYSNRQRGDSEEYNGWTAITFPMIEDLSLLGVWLSEEEFIYPEEAVLSDGTTGTRSICRSSDSIDKNERGDWHIVPTGEKSFGLANSDQIHEPK